MVPKGWSSWILSDICRKQISYGIVQTGDNLPNGIPCLRVVDLTRDVMRLEDMIKTSEETNKAYRKTILEKDEIVMALRGEIGLARLIDDNLVGANITRGLARISPETKVVLPEFLLWELRSPQFRADLIRRVGGSALQEISLTELRKVRTLLPPLLEQKKIAKILSTWDKAISVTEKLLANSQRQKKALMQQLLTGNKRLLDENGVRFSREWKQVELGDVFEKVSNGLTYDANSLDGLPVTRIETISTGRVNFEKVGWAPDCDNTRRFKLNLGDILYSHINSLEHIGRVAYFNDDKPLYHGMNLLLLRTKMQNNSLFLFHLLNSQVGKKYAKTYAKSAVNQASISTTDIKTFKVFIPERLEQQKIASVLSAADAEISILEKKLACLKDEKKALMQQLLTGKRRVKVDEAVAV
ncbi:restriction endonuclease subunit S [Escherichia sp. WS499]|uniref:restriction endonuclease subunit S n=1 Tax=Escherichia sp. WS499 TaxID=3381997 RepID=UPI00396F5766